MDTKTQSIDEDRICGDLMDIQGAGDLFSLHQLTIDELKAQRAWLVDYGFREYLRAGYSFKLARQAVGRELGKINAEIARKEVMS